MNIHFMRTHDFDILLYDNHEGFDQQADNLPAGLPLPP